MAKRAARASSIAGPQALPRTPVKVLGPPPLSNEPAAVARRAARAEERRRGIARAVRSWCAAESQRAERRYSPCLVVLLMGAGLYAGQLSLHWLQGGTGAIADMLACFPG